MAFNGILYRKAGGTLELNRSVGGFCAVESAKLEDTWQEGGVVTLVLKTTEVLTFYSGDYIIAKGNRYLVCKTISEYTTLDDGRYQYTVPLNSPDALFKNALMYNTTEVEDGGVYSWTRPNNFIMELGSVEVLVKTCCYNVNEVMGRRVFKLGTIDASVSDEYRVINFSDRNCWAGLKQTCEDFNTFYTIRVNTDETPDSDYIVDIGVEPGTFPETLQVGMRQGIAELTMDYADEDVYTQFIVQGSSENLPRGYPHERLQLDEDLGGVPPVYAGSLMVDESKYTRWGRKRMELVFEDIKPTRTATITGLPAENILAFYDTSLSDIIAIQPNWNPVGGTVHILDGNLMGYTFEIIGFHSGTYKITIKQISDSNGLVLPNEEEETFRFAKDMKYNLAGISLPDSYVVDAKTSLKAAAVEAMEYWTNPRGSFSLTPDPFFLRTNEVDISCGWLIPIKHDALEIDKSIRVTSVTYDLLKDTYFDIDSVEVADITGKDNFMNSVHKSTQRSLNMLRDQGIINSPTAKDSNLTALLNRIALSLHLPNWDTLLEMLGNDKGLFTMINEEGEDIHVVNVDLLRAGTALVNSLYANELFISGVQDETGSLVNNYLLHLTSQVATVACDSEGTVTGTLPTSTAIVYHGASADTGWSFSGELSGCTGSVNEGTGVITITGLTADDSTVTVSATKADKPTLQATFRISKVYAGVDGADGEDGVTTYTWIKYADVADGTGLYDTPTANTLYIGIAVNKTTPTESTTKTDYTWSKFKGDQGVAGDDGVTTYTWIKYGTSSAGAGITDDPTGMTYIGFAYNKTTPTESTTPGDYTWSLIKGTDGVDGADGEDGAASVIYYLTPSVDNVVKSMSGTLTPSSVTCAQYKVVGNAAPVAGDKTIKYQLSGGALTTYTEAVNIGTASYVDFFLYDGEVELWRTRVPVILDASDIEYIYNSFADGDTYVAGGLVLSSFVGVLDGTDAVVAGMAGEDFVLDGETPITSPMFFAGSTTAQNANNAKFRVYQDGSMYAELGEIGGLTIAASKLYLGTGNHNNADTAFYVDDDGKFSLKNKLSFDGTNLTINGGGTFTGSVSIGDILIGKDAYGSGLHGIKLNTYNYWYLNDTNAELKIGGETNNLSWNGSVLEQNGVSIIGGSIVGTSINIPNATTPLFKVTADGVITAKSGTIGGVNFTDTKLYLGTGTYGNSNTGFYVDTSAKFSLKDKLKFDGTNLTINGGGTFSGALSAATGSFSGSLSAAGGTFSGLLDVDGIKIGLNAISAGIDGLYINANNYWDESGNFKAGGSASYVYWNGTTFAIKGDITGSTGTFGGVFAGTIEVGSTLKMGADAGGTGDFGIYIDSANYWLESGFSVGVGTSLLYLDGSTMKFSGELSAAGGIFAGRIEVGGDLKIGADVSGANDGIFINTNNYWYGTGALKIGDAYAYLSYNAGALTMVGGSITSGSFTATDGSSTSVTLSAAAVGGKSGFLLSGSGGAASIYYDSSESYPVFKAASSTDSSVLYPDAISTNSSSRSAMLWQNSTIGAELNLHGSASGYISIRSRVSGNPDIRGFNSSGVTSFRIEHDGLFIASLPSTEQSSGNFWRDSNGIIRNGSQGLNFSVVSSLPYTPSANTIYFVTGS